MACSTRADIFSFGHGRHNAERRDDRVRALAGAEMGHELREQIFALASACWRGRGAGGFQMPTLWHDGFRTSGFRVAK